jgi:hypothetical protein
VSQLVQLFVSAVRKSLRCFLLFIIFFNVDEFVICKQWMQGNLPQVTTMAMGLTSIVSSMQYVSTRHPGEVQRHTLQQQQCHELVGCEFAK